jgi:hypothetical protein
VNLAIPLQDLPTGAIETALFTTVCVQVWIALVEKKIPFDTVLINLFDKPAWYAQVASNNQTPAVRLDGENTCESLDNLLVCLSGPFTESTCCHTVRGLDCC